MKRRTMTRTDSGKPPSRVVVLSLMVGLFAVLVFGLRVLSPPATEQTGDDTNPVLRGPNSPEVKRHRLDLEAENRRFAYKHAQDFARAELFPNAVTTLFPDITHPELEITRLHPHRYRVRSRVTWKDAGGSLQHRRFETDLQHGPTDSRWRLLDTEFLDTPRNRPEANTLESLR